MPLISSISESTTKLRFGYQQSQQSEPSYSVMKSSSSPDLSLKSSARDRDKTCKSDDVETVPDGGVRSFEFQEDPSFWKEHNVQVIIRIRPLSSSELSVQGNNRCVKQDSSQSVTWIGHPESRFTFDLVADENVSQEMMFNVAGVRLVENCMEGYNSCMFAYGQTGSGKTHTMLGDIEGGARRHSVNCGMTPRVFEYLFSRIQKDKDARREEKLKFTCRCSFLEIYNEQILDLLDPSSINLQIREDSKKGVYVENLKEVEVTSARDVIQQLIQGAANRKVASTNMNRASSRSHSVFTCIIESKWDSQGVTHHRFARLNLVDLAGSERQKSSGAEGERLKEATNINKSLSTLGLVIMNLVSVSNGRSQHIPYRDSKLTFLLQDSLGGNAKTIIIANISPSTCCSLETLSTLKFAQRAKFIKNHAIVNEDASGDVLALRLENQNLKKEVSRLRCLVTGGVESYDGDNLSLAFPGSPGSLKWDGIPGLPSPLMSGKKMSHLPKKEYEIALVGALRREKDKDSALQAKEAENQAALQLAKQREDEIQGLKMRLRFREAGLKRLEAVASGKISAEIHLLKEKEEYLKEIEVLRAQVDRNQEATRFAMENLRLKEEIRRLKSFCEEGERERMTEQIMILENKLLEALDWKLMHESDLAKVQKGSPNIKMDTEIDDYFLSSNLGSQSPWRTSANEENEFLRIQAIQNQSELDSLRKRLEFYIDEKEKLERHVNDLVKELEAEKLSKEATAEQVQNRQSDQTEIKTMVDAIAAASQREAEAHEFAALLSRENEELRIKLNVLVEDNNKLIDLYERATAANNRSSCNDSLNPQEKSIEDHRSHLTEVTAEQELEMERELESLKHQLAEMHDENEKLLSLYEKAMQEESSMKDRRSHLTEVTIEKELEMERELESLKHHLAEMQEENERLLSLYEKAMQEESSIKNHRSHLAEVTVEKELEMGRELESLKHQLAEMHEENEKLLSLYENAMQKESSIEDHKSHISEVQVQKELEMEREVESLKHQLAEMHEENEKLLSLCENAMQMESSTEDHKSHIAEVHIENELEMKTEHRSLERQLAEMHEENDKLLSLYEKAMQERDEYKRVIASAEPRNGGKKGDLSRPEKLVEIDEGQCLRFGEASMSIDDEWGRKALDSLDLYLWNDRDDLNLEANPVISVESLLEESNMYEVHVQEDGYSQSSLTLDANHLDPEEATKHSLSEVVKSGICESVEQYKMEIDDSMEHEEQKGSQLIANTSCAGINLEMEEKSAGTVSVDVCKVSVDVCKEGLDALRKKLVEAQETLSYSANTMRVMAEIDALSQEICRLESGIQAKNQDCEYLKSLCTELCEKKDVANKKLLSVTHSLTGFSTSLRDFESNESQARSMLNATSQNLIERKKELAHLQVSRKDLMDSLSKFRHAETETRSILENLRSKLEEENKKLESDRLLFAIENVEKTAGELLQRNWQKSCKATELLKSEEQKMKLQNQINLTRENLRDGRKEVEALKGKLSKMDSEIQVVEMELQKEMLLEQEMQKKVQSIVQEKGILLESKSKGSDELESMIIEYHQSLFEAALKEEELKVLDEEMANESRKVEGLRREKAESMKKKADLSDKMEEDLHNIQTSVAELNFLLQHCGSVNC